jgi:hypothetical protein
MLLTLQGVEQDIQTGTDSDFTRAGGRVHRVDNTESRLKSA